MENDQNKYKVTTVYWTTFVVDVVQAASFFGIHFLHTQVAMFLKLHVTGLGASFKRVNFSGKFVNFLCI